ncbi:MAG: biotin/lipoyl-containing protein, partial [Thermoanaerobaculia bacterium]
MATEVVMPQMGESIAEGTITRWLVKVGEKVERDQPLFEISTDKVDAEIPSPAAGVLLEIRNKEGETVPVNQVVAMIGESGAAGATAPAAAAPAATAPSPVAAAAAPQSAAPVAPVAEAAAPAAVAAPAPAANVAAPLS